MPNFSPEGKRNQLIGFVVGLVLFVLLGNLAFTVIFADRIYPGITINDVRVGGLTKKEAWTLLQQELPELPTVDVTLSVDDIRVSTPSAALEVKRDLDTAIESAYTIGRAPDFLSRIRQRKYMLLNIFKPTPITSRITYSKTAADILIEELNQKILVAGELPAAKLGTSRAPNTVSINVGKIGREIDVEKTHQQIWDSLQNSNYEIAASVTSTGALLNDDEVIAAKEQAQRLVGKRIILRAPDARVEIDDQQLVSFLQPPSGLKGEEMDEAMDNWEKLVNREAENAEFEYDKDTLKVTTFKPHRDGLTLNRDQTAQRVSDAIFVLLAEEPAKPSVINEYNDTELELVVETLKPDVILADTNDLGITESIGFGESEYDHSIPNRIHNVAITTERIDNIIIAPGAEFSFNKNVGEVSALTGYKSAYVIKNGKTELGDGGGVCQVSTTLFRAVLNAGLEVTRRLPHSYRVGYYELNSKPGIDATVYSGEVDFRFRNDTNHHILIHARADSENLYMKITLYGTSDGRTSEISNHEVWDFRPAPPTEYYPDPSLKPGQRKQIDWSVGGVKAKFTNTVRDKDGNIIRENTYNSNYKPWSAKYLVGV